MTFYGTLVSGAGWIVPKKYVEQVGDDGFRKQPIGLGPYRFVSYTPGVELIMEANESYWRKMPSIKRLVYKMVPEASTRLAMLKRGEVDLAYLLDAPMAMEVKRDPNLKLAFSGAIGVFFLDFFDQWDPKSPWHDRRVRLASMLAIDARSVNEAENLGASRLTGSLAPRTFEFTLALEPYPHNPARAKQLLAEAGYPNGFDAGDLYPYPPYFSMGEAVAGYLGAIGIRTKIRTMERAAFVSAWAIEEAERACASASAPSMATPPRACRSSCRAMGCSPRAPIPTSTRSTSSRRARPTRRSGRPCFIASSSSSMSECDSGRSTSTSGRAGWGRAWRSPRS